MNCKNLIVLTMLCACFAVARAQVTSSITIIPQPVMAFGQNGQFELKADTRIYYPQGKAGWDLAAQFWMATAQASTGFQLVATPTKTALTSLRPNGIYFIDDPGLEHEEGYKMEVTPEYISIQARSAAGAFYAVQSLRQMFPAQINSPNPVQGVEWKASCCKLTDYPRFPYRGLHLDVGRHFFPVDYIKRFIDLLALHKLNRFHWHLTEDQGWRIEIKKYPQLQSISACRKETLEGHDSQQPAHFDGQRYCGYYTQEEIKEVVEYARKRFVTIVPEIEMPGHSLAALAAFPELSCTGGPHETATTWGVFDDVFCAGNEKTFAFLDDVLAEVCALFPGAYVHIGGDECLKTRWHNCPKCQKRMKDEGLRDEQELQSYFIRRAEKMLAARGKKLIGWDEILEGGLAPTATVMSWRGTAGGITAAKAGHDAIMSPGTHCYFDQYQGDPASEPLAIGGLTTLERVYSYEPVPDSLSEETARHILGVQGNVWTEYIATPEKAEYMTYPRACALSEVGWTPRKKKVWEDFARRMKTHFGRLEVLGVHYAKNFYDIRSGFSGGYVSLSCADRTLQIKYTRDGSDPKPTSSGHYGPIPLEKTTTLKAAAFSKDGKMMGNLLTVTYYVHKASGKPYTLSTQPSQYSGGERYALTNGVAGAQRTWTHWVGLPNGADFDPVIDLGAETDFSRVTTHYLSEPGSWIYPPRSIEVLVSDDGQNFRSLAQKTVDVGTVKGSALETVVLDTPGAHGRYLKLVAKNYGTIPAGAAGAGNGAWLFLDEILVD